MSDVEPALEATWADLDRIVAALAHRIRGDGQPDVIVEIARGGMIPAVVLAHRLRIRTVQAV